VAVHPTAAAFDHVAVAYSAGRPGYPRAAVELVAARLGIAGGRVVVDIGAGTGKLTEELLTRGADVVAVEPVAGMREHLASTRASDRLRVVGGVAEALPLAAGTMDAATVAQAFQWFDGPAALAEIHRVLRPGSWLAVVFNRRDLSTPVQAGIDQLLAPYRGDTPTWARHDWDGALRTTDRFVPAREGIATFPLVQQLTLDGLRARVASTSFVAELDAATRRRILAAVSDLHATHRDAAADAATVSLHYVTEVRLLRRLEPS
jgi:SAM-dependent methyltransferase